LKRAGGKSGLFHFGVEVWRGTGGVLSKHDPAASLADILENSSGMEVTGRALNRYNAWAAIRKRAKAAGFLTPVGCHTWRATGITIYLENDDRLEHAQQMAGHESPRTTKLYDRTKDEITLSEVERIRM
jgi:integrase